MVVVVSMSTSHGSVSVVEGTGVLDVVGSDVAGSDVAGDVSGVAGTTEEVGVGLSGTEASEA